MKETTVTIRQETAKKIERLSKLGKTTKKDFLASAVAYFEKFGINPMEHDSPKTEIELMRKRLDQVIAFNKTQEKEVIRPMFEAVTTSVENLKVDFSQHTQKMADFIIKMQVENENAQKFIVSEMAKILNAAIKIVNEHNTKNEH
jgi:hypothetical protein